MFGLIRGDNPDLVPAHACCPRAAFPGGANAITLSVLQERSGHGDGIRNRKQGLDVLSLLVLYVSGNIIV